jgi:hypothetical protein
MIIPAATKYRAWMERTGPSVTRALATAVSTWPQEHRLLWWFRHLGLKLVCTFRDFEYPNNINFYFYRRSTPILRYLPTFGWLSGLGVAGCVILAARGRDRRAVLPLLAVALAPLAGIMASFALGRYRMPLALLLTVPAGAALSCLVDWWGQRRLLALSLTAACAIVVSLASFRLAPTRVSFAARETIYLRGANSRVWEEAKALRPMEFTAAARILADRGDREGARALLRDYVAELRHCLRHAPPSLDKWGRSALGADAADALQQVVRCFRDIGMADEADALNRDGLGPSSGDR